jgi:four helix bundle protein
MLQFRNLDAYRYAVALLEVVFAISADVPPPHLGVAEGLQRAALAVLRALAEAHHRQPDNRAEARLCYAHARGSAFECVALVDTLERVRAVSAGEAARAREILTRVIAMLCRLEGEATAAPPPCG